MVECPLMPSFEDFSIMRLIHTIGWNIFFLSFILVQPWDEKTKFQNLRPSNKRQRGLGGNFVMCTKERAWVHHFGKTIEYNTTSIVWITIGITVWESGRSSLHPMYFCRRLNNRTKDRIIENCTSIPHPGDLWNYWHEIILLIDDIILKSTKALVNTFSNFSFFLHALHLDQLKKSNLMNETFYPPKKNHLKQA